MTLLISLAFAVLNGLAIVLMMATGAVLPGGVVAFYGVTVDDNSEILIVDLPTTLVINLTQHPAEDRFPSWSPDGRRLAFVSDRTGTERVYTLHPTESEVRLLTPPEPLNAYDYLSYQYPHWSHDGQRVLFTRAPTPGMYQIPLYSADLSSGTLRYITQTTDDGQDYIEQLMSAMDNSLYLDESNGQIMLHILQDGEQPHSLPVADAVDYITGSFRRYPERILLVINTQDGSTLSVISPDGVIQQRVPLGDVIARDPAWRPD